RKALEIIFKFHPAFKGNASSIHMPAREFSLELAQKLTEELGFSNINAAIKDIFG
ncbi:hypothetical protein LCGC14_1822770, partial [marine sediment metagenome]